MDHIRRDLGQRDEHEPSEVKARVRQHQLRAVDDSVAGQEQVQIESAGTMV
jgi:hypothetical protein